MMPAVERPSTLKRSGGREQPRDCATGGVPRWPYRVPSSSGNRGVLQADVNIALVRVVKNSACASITPGPYKRHGLSLLAQDPACGVLVQRAVAWRSDKPRAAGAAFDPPFEWFVVCSSMTPKMGGGQTLASPVPWSLRLQ
jgi:hypothetical protein